MANYFQTGTSVEFSCSGRSIQNFPLFYSDKFRAELEQVINRLSRVNLPIFVFINENQDRVWKQTLDDNDFEPIYVGSNAWHHERQIILYVKDRNYDG